jgi:hypothetical protein
MWMTYPHRGLRFLGRYAMPEELAFLQKLSADPQAHFGLRLAG